MKNVLTFCFFFTSILSINGQQQTHALLIAAHGYNEESKWNELGESTLTDMQLVRNALLERGVPNENIYILDSGATKQAIVNAVENILIPSLKKGDVVMFHFSGHGYQIPDNNKDELDGLDEALVPINAKNDGGRRKDYTYYANYLRDDELNKLLENIRLALGPNGDLFVTIDACHSGTSTRGIGPSRGAVRLDLDTYQNADTEETWEPLSEQKDLSNMVAFFASGQSQLNSEYQEGDLSCGSLSFALSKAISSSTSTTSYQALFEKVRNTMIGIVPAQTPSAEGTLNTTIFGGTLLPAAQFLRVKDVLENNIIVISGGLLASINTGSIIGFFEPDTREFSIENALFTGKVTASSTTECEVTAVNIPTSIEKTSLLWAQVLEKNFGNVAVSIQLKNFNKEITKQLENEFKDVSFISFSKGKKTDLFIELDKSSEGDPNPIKLSALGDVEFALSSFEVSEEEELTQVQINWLVQKISDYAQGKFLRNLSIDNAEYSATIYLTEVNKIEGTSGRSAKDYSEVGRITSNKIKVGKFLRVDIHNNSNRVLYYSILDIDASGKISIVCPKSGRLPEEYKVVGNALSTNSGLIVKMSPPLGQGVLKLVVTKQPLNLSGLVTSRGEAANAASSFDMFFQSTIKGKSRGMDTLPIELEEIGIYDFVYEIVK
jgi:metacaspase-1